MMSILEILGDCETQNTLRDCWLAPRAFRGSSVHTSLTAAVLFFEAVVVQPLARLVTVAHARKQTKEYHEAIQSKG